MRLLFPTVPREREDWLSPFLSLFGAPPSLEAALHEARRNRRVRGGGSQRLEALQPVGEDRRAETATRVDLAARIEDRLHEVMRLIPLVQPGLHDADRHAERLADECHFTAPQRNVRRTTDDTLLTATENIDAGVGVRGDRAIRAPASRVTQTVLPGRRLIARGLAIAAGRLVRILVPVGIDAVGTRSASAERATARPRFRILATEVGVGRPSGVSIDRTGIALSEGDNGTDAGRIIDLRADQCTVTVRPAGAIHAPRPGEDVRTHLHAGVGLRGDGGRGVGTEAEQDVDQVSEGVEIEIDLAAGAVEPHRSVLAAVDREHLDLGGLGADLLVVGVEVLLQESATQFADADRHARTTAANARVHRGDVLDVEALELVLRLGREETQMRLRDRHGGHVHALDPTGEFRRQSGRRADALHAEVMRVGHFTNDDHVGAEIVLQLGVRTLDHSDAHAGIDANDAILTPLGERVDGGDSLGRGTAVGFPGRLGHLDDLAIRLGVADRLLGVGDPLIAAGCPSEMQEDLDFLGGADLPDLNEFGMDGASTGEELDGMFGHDLFLLPLCGYGCARPDWMSERRG